MIELQLGYDAMFELNTESSVWIHHCSAPKGSPYRARGPTNGSKRAKLLSLTKVSRESNKLWTGPLLQNVELEVTRHLSSFLSFLLKAPNAGEPVQHLRFITTMTEEQEQDDPFGAW